jgi:hypothetical protein
MLFPGGIEFADRAELPRRSSATQLGQQSVSSLVRLGYVLQSHVFDHYDVRVSNQSATSQFVAQRIALDECGIAFRTRHEGIKVNLALVGR